MDSKCFIIIAPYGQKFRCWDKSIVPKDFTIPKRDDVRYYDESGILLPCFWALWRFKPVTKEQLKHSFELVEDEDDLLERDITKKIKKYLDKKLHVWYFKAHGHAMQRAGIPDIIACVYGLFLGIEIKKTTGGVTKIQKHCHDQIEYTGLGTVIVVYGFEDFKKKFNPLYELFWNHFEQLLKKNKDKKEVIK